MGGEVLNFKYLGHTFMVNEPESDYHGALVMVAGDREDGFNLIELAPTPGDLWGPNTVLQPIELSIVVVK